MKRDTVMININQKQRCPFCWTWLWVCTYTNHFKSIINTSVYLLFHIIACCLLVVSRMIAKLINTSFSSNEVQSTTLTNTPFNYILLQINHQHYVLTYKLYVNILLDLRYLLDKGHSEG